MCTIRIGCKLLSFLLLFSSYTDIIQLTGAKHRQIVWCVPWIGEHFWGSKVASKVSSSISQMLAIERYHNCLIWILPISVVWLHLLEIKAWNALKIRSYLSPQNPTATQQSKENWVSAPLWEVCFYTVTSTLSTQLTASLAMINRRLKVKLIFFSENAS